MARRKRPKTLREAQDEEILRAGGRDSLLSWDTRLVHRTKRWTRVLAGVAGLMAAAGTAASAVKGQVTKLWRIATRPQIAPAELPATGQPTIATDHVEKPTPPQP